MHIFIYITHISNKFIRIEKLADIKNQIQEEQNDLVADMFYWTSGVVLRSAYIRFRHAILYRLRCTQLYKTIKNIYSNILLNKVINGWKSYIRQLHIARIIEDKYFYDLKMNMFQTWKVSTL